ncbi:DUF6402 family protein [Burkholderia stabilis]|uniref:DUF6402 family protein n=1 Tax=Burkholderia stabilis TaxID=95485 RepID=UPI000B1321BE|nr:DUF6402 family protein [Burkholderia stabilis]HDR9492756.1 hypothetical protein [Burkholderia stabilis]HDR9525083.1 hypothetical protein [Burkholderia stabilis]HDR9532216.1 hypothetical protein [Burkholderia stabilis]HDR9540067.1 hypothetical protein [Burkholderia stabilis]HDR9548485.1 hypothetical protein [Burkholderia stabilis]
MEADNQKLPYHKPNKLLWRWTHCEGDEGCRIIRGLCLSMARLPPVPDSKVSADKPIKSRKTVRPDPATKMLDDIERMVNAHARFRKWLNTPSPPKPPAPAPEPKKKEPQVEPFDIQEIPGAMRKLMMPISATLMEKWFAGRLNYSPTVDDERNGINQDGVPYPPDMIDTTTVKLEWVLKYARAKEQFDNLTSSAINSNAALRVIRARLLPYKHRYPVISITDMCSGDIQLIHHHFHFQYAKVEGTFEQKALQYLKRLTEANGIPDDLTGALGSFNLYAAVERAEISFDGTTAAITHISVYVKDNYTFGTEPGEPSQYLGHWNARSVNLVPATLAMHAFGRSWIDYPVGVGDLRKKENFLYPVRNQDFRAWQTKHRRGGDFVIYSDRRIIRLRYPVYVNLS